MIPFIKTFDFEYGVPKRVSELATRVVARNPGRFTGPGTGALVMGDGDVAVIDPGPDRDDHLEAIGRAIAGRRVGAVLVTHNHLDHSALARRLANQFDAPLYGCRGLATPNDGAVRLDAADVRPLYFALMTLIGGASLGLGLLGAWATLAPLRRNVPLTATFICASNTTALVFAAITAEKLAAATGAPTSWHIMGALLAINLVAWSLNALSRGQSIAP